MENASFDTAEYPLDSTPDVMEPSPEGVTVATAPGVPVAVKVNGEPVRPVLVAVKVFVPAVVPRVQLPMAAIPRLLVVGVAKVTDPPPVATAKVTLTPLTGLPTALVTVTLTGVGNAVPTGAV